MPIKIQNARAFQRLVRAFSVQGRMQLFLDDHVVPVAIVEDLSESGTDVRVDAWAFIRANATAAVGGAVQLTNAGPNSAVDLIVDEIKFWASAATAIAMNLTTATDGALLTGIANKVWADTNQLPGIPAGVPDHRDGSAYAAEPSLTLENLLAANTPITIRPGFTLAPTQKLVIRAFTVNIQLNSYWKYRVISRTGQP